MLRIIAAFVVLIVLAGSAWAERRMALVIGEDDYRSVRKLDNAVADAQSIQATLEKLGFTVTLETDRNLKRLRRALEDFEEDADGADVALVYYAGHGVEIAGENRLLPTDTDASSLEALKASTLPLEDVRAAVAHVSKVGLIILDACRNDPFGATAADAESRGVVAIAKAPEVKPGLGRIGRAEGILFAFSAAPGETAADGADGHSPFAVALAKYLGTDGLEVRSALTLVQQEVYDQSRGAQLPYVENGLPALFFAATTKEQLPERERLLLAMADVSPDLRAEVEQVAAQNDMPLAPLYGALISSDLAAMSASERTDKLSRAARDFVQTRKDLLTFASEDPAVTALRKQAEDQLSLGAFQAARARLAEAAAIDSQSRQALKTNYVERTLSEATTHYLSAGTARVELNYRAAIAELGKSTALYAEVGNDLDIDQELQRLLVMQSMGGLQETVGDLPAAAATYGDMSKVVGVRLEKEPQNLAALRADMAVKQFLGDVSFAQGNVADALAAFRSILETHEKMSAAGVDFGVNDDVVLIQLRIGDALRRQGKFAQAGDAYQAAMAEIERLRTRAPDDPRWTKYASLTQSRIGDNLTEAGNGKDALAIFRAQLERSRALAAAHPDDREMQDNLSADYDRIADALRDQRDLKAAYEAYEASRQIRLKLVEADPGRAVYKDSLGISYSRLGDLFMMVNDLERARDAYSQARQLCKELADLDPTNQGWQRGLMIAYERLGDVDRLDKQLDAAGEEYSAALDIVAKLSAADPSDDQTYRDLSVANSKVGLVAGMKGDYDAALKHYSEDFRISSERAARNPTSGAVQYDLAISQEHMGDIYGALKQWDKAVAAYRERERIIEALAAADPGNASLQRERLVSQMRLAELDDDAIHRYERMLALAKELDAAGRLAPTDRWVIAEAQSRLETLRKAAAPQ